MRRTRTTAHALHLRAQVSAPVITRALDGRASLASAIKLHLATGRDVPIESMTREQLDTARALRRSKVAR